MWILSDQKLTMPNINWFELPYSHSWEKNVDSIMNPGSKVTWPQYVAEMVIYWRTQIIKDYKEIKRGPGWYKTIPKVVRDLNQQASVICNYFPHINDEPLVAVAFRNYFRRTHTLKIGQFRKVRFTEKNGRKILNITQDEKTIIIGITAELERLLEQRNIFAKASEKVKAQAEKKDVSFKTTTSTPKKGSLASILALEQKQIKKDPPQAE